MTVRAVGHDALKTLVENASSPVIALEPNGHIRLINTVAAQVFELDVDKVAGTQLTDHPAIAPLAAWVEQAHVNGTVTGDIDLADGQQVTAHLLVTSPHAAATEQTSLNSASIDIFLKKLSEAIHDLKTPIAASSGFLDLVGAFGELNARQDGYIRRAQLTLNTVLTQVDQLLDFAWLEVDGQLKLNPTDLAQITGHVASQMEGYAHRGGVDLILELDDTESPINGDERRLVGAVTNLISNAIKYSPEGGPVRITVDTIDKRARLRVVDQGLGIAPEELERIWEPQYRVDTPETRRIEGSGLGLGIVYSVVKKHNGDVFVSSTPGQGSEFGFWLPLLDAAD